MPSMPGILISVSTTGGFSSANISSPLAPSSAVKTVYPSLSRDNFKRSLVLASSSITSSFFMPNFPLADPLRWKARENES